MTAPRRSGRGRGMPGALATERDRVKLVREHRSWPRASRRWRSWRCSTLTGVIPHLPDAKKLIEDVATTLGPWTYVLVGLMAFLETGAFIGLIAPGETTILVGGVIAGQGEIELIPLIGLIWVCAVLGDTTSFFIGRRLGRDFMLSARSAVQDHRGAAGPGRGATSSATAARRS